MPPERLKPAVHELANCVLPLAHDLGDLAVLHVGEVAERDRFGFGSFELADAESNELAVLAFLDGRGRHDRVGAAFDELVARDGRVLAAPEMVDQGVSGYSEEIMNVSGAVPDAVLERGESLHKDGLDQVFGIALVAQPEKEIAIERSVMRNVQLFSKSAYVLFSMVFVQ